MRLACLMITTTVKERLPLLKQTIDSIEVQNHPFDQKILSVDIVEGHPFHQEDFASFTELGWMVVPGVCTGRAGMANNIQRGLCNLRADTDFIFYCEDDVVIQRIPSKYTVDELFTHYEAGAVLYNTHIHDLADTDKKAARAKKYCINTASNYVGFVDDYGYDGREELFLEKGDALKDEYWLCFPVAIFQLREFRRCLNYAMKYHIGMGFEPGMTKAWFDLGIGDKKDVFIYVKPEIQNTPDFYTRKLALDFQDFHNFACMKFWNNDESLRHPSVNDRQNSIF